VGAFLLETIDQLIDQTCKRLASKAALREKQDGAWVETSYEQLAQQAEGIGAGLSATGFEPGTSAAILASPSSCWVSAYLGILKAGGVVVPIDRELKTTEIRHVLTDCQARVLFTEPAFNEPLEELLPALSDLEHIIYLRADRRQSKIESDRLEIQEDLDTLVRTLSELARRYEIDEKDIEKLQELLRKIEEDLPDAEQTGRQRRGRKKALLPRIGKSDRDLSSKAIALTEFMHDDFRTESLRKADDPAMILYTSGTTGRSKGAILSHANVTSNIQAAKSIFALNEDMRTLSFLPINHVYELVCGILLPLSVGGTVSFAESLKELGRNLAEVKPTFLLGVPAVFEKLHARILKAINEKSISRMLFRFSPTRSIVKKKVRRLLGDGTIFVSGGAALDPDTAAGMAQLGVDIYQGYGITETSPIVAAERPGRQKLGTVGLPLPGVDVRIDSPNKDGVGEIWVKGPNVMQGYYNNDRATREILTDGWYHTGDLGSLDEEGYLSIRGRVKNLIVTPNGKNVYPEEVENELTKSPFIAEAMVYGHKISPSAEDVHAIIVPDQENLDAHAHETDSFPLDEKDVEAIIREEVVKACRRLADFKRVRKFTLREEELPKTTTRKIKRFAVEAEIPARTAGAVTRDRSRSG
jgi:long-chain acyl-CoA synthetase